MKCVWAVCIGLLAGTTAWGSLDQGLVACYPFNGNANDESGGGWNGTVHGAALTTNRFGDADSAYSFDGVNDYINIGNCLGTENTPFTVSIWVCSTAGKEAGNDIYIAKKDDGPWEPGQWGMSSGENGNVVFTFNDFDGNNIPPRAIVVARDIKDGVWHHLCATMSPKGSKLFIDGELAGTNNVPQLVAQHNSDILIGRRVDSFQPYHTDGKLDDVRIYNRELSAAEVMALYASPMPFAGFYPSTTHVHFGDENEAGHLFFTGSFVLDEASDGLNPAEEAVVIEAGPLAIEIPAGSLRIHRSLYIWNGTVNAARIKAILMQHNEDCYSFLIMAHGVDLTGWSNPENWSLTIGNDFGNTTQWLKGHLLNAGE